MDGALQAWVGRAVRTVVLAFGLAAGLSAQSPPAVMTLAEVKATGLQRYSLADVVKASGLAIGTRVSIAELQAAADRLSKSGMAASVSFEYTYKGDVVTVTFGIEEAQVETDVIFDNFPWFAADELTRLVAENVPGFSGRIANVADVIDTIEQTLERLLAGKRISGGVDYMPFLDAASGRRAHLFRAQTSLPICDVSLDGVDVPFKDDLVDAVGPLRTREYLLTSASTFATNALVPIYRRHGHLRATSGVPRAIVAASGSCADRVIVVLPVTEGLRYTWQGATWSGHRLFSLDELSAKLGVRPGQVANGIKLDEGLQAIERAYGRRGHISARPAIQPQYNDAARTVLYQIAIDEGPQYRVGRVTFASKNPQVRDAMESAWKLKVGDVFDAEYGAEFLAALRDREPVLSRSIGTFNLEVRPQRDAPLVDLVVTLE